MKIVEVLKELTADDIKKLRHNKKPIPSYLLGRSEIVGRKIRVSDADFNAHKEFFKEVEQGAKKGKVSKSVDA